MNAFSIVIAAFVISGARTDVAPEQVPARFEALCVDGKWDAAACPALQSELELQLYGDLRELQQVDVIDRATLAAAARANFPLLAELGLRKLVKIENAVEREAVTRAIEHPSPNVRARAKFLLKDDEKWKTSFGPWWRGKTDLRVSIEGLIPDLVPEVSKLGVSRDLLTNTFRYRYFASEDGDRAVFTTKLAPEKALALIVKGGKIFNGSQLPPDPSAQAETAGAMAKQQEEYVAALQRGDMKKAEEIAKRLDVSLKGMMGNFDAATAQETSGMRAVTEFKAPPASVLYVRLASQEGYFQPYVAAARDEIFGGETVVVVLFNNPNR